MSVNLKKYQRLKEKADEAKRQQERAIGVLQTLFKELKTKFGCSTLDEAKKKLKEMEAERDTLEASFKKKLAAYEKEFGELLDAD